jgi:hypothetical protein
MGPHLTFLLNFLEVEQDPNRLPAHARNKFSLYGFLGHQANCPARSPFYAACGPLGLPNGCRHHSPQVVVGRPFEEFERCYEGWREPSAVLHLLRGKTLTQRPARAS